MQENLIFEKEILIEKRKKIQEEISKILMLEIKDDDIKFVTVTACDTSTDLSYCKVYVTVLNEEKKETTLKSLNNASSFIRGILAKKIQIRHIPELKFIYDTSIAYGEHIDNLIEEINKKENN